MIKNIIMCFLVASSVVSLSGADTQRSTQRRLAKKIAQLPAPRFYWNNSFYLQSAAAKWDAKTAWHNLALGDTMTYEWLRERGVSSLNISKKVALFPALCKDIAKIALDLYSAGGVPTYEAVITILRLKEPAL